MNKHISCLVAVGAILLGSLVGTSVSAIDLSVSSEQTAVTYNDARIVVDVEGFYVGDFAPYELKVQELVQLLQQRDLQVVVTYFADGENVFQETHPLRVDEDLETARLSAELRRLSVAPNATDYTLTIIDGGAKYQDDNVENNGVTGKVDPAYLSVYTQVDFSLDARRSEVLREKQTIFIHVDPPRDEFIYPAELPVMIQWENEFGGQLSTPEYVMAGTVYGDGIEVDNQTLVAEGRISRPAGATQARVVVDAGNTIQESIEDNNDVVLPYDGRTETPDLVFDRRRTSITPERQEIVIRDTADNEDVQGFDVSFVWISAAGEAEGDFLGQRATRFQDGLWRVVMEVPRPGNEYDDFRIVIDSGNEIDETDEDNNTVDGRYEPPSRGFLGRLRGLFGGNTEGRFEVVNARAEDQREEEFNGAEGYDRARREGEFADDRARQEAAIARSQTVDLVIRDMRISNQTGLVLELENLIDNTQDQYLPEVVPVGLYTEAPAWSEDGESELIHIYDFVYDAEEAVWKHPFTIQLHARTGVLEEDGSVTSIQSPREVIRRNGAETLTVVIDPNQEIENEVNRDNHSRTEQYLVDFYFHLLGLYFPGQEELIPFEYLRLEGRDGVLSDPGLPYPGRPTAGEEGAALKLRIDEALYENYKPTDVYVAVRYIFEDERNRSLGAAIGEATNPELLAERREREAANTRLTYGVVDPVFGAGYYDLPTDRIPDGVVGIEVTIDPNREYVENNRENNRMQLFFDAELSMNVENIYENAEEAEEGMRGFLEEMEEMANDAEEADEEAPFYVLDVPEEEPGILPGSLFYPVKQAWRWARVTVASEEEKADLYLDFHEEKLLELVILERKDANEPLPEHREWLKKDILKAQKYLGKDDSLDRYKRMYHQEKVYQTLLEHAKENAAEAIKAKEAAVKDLAQTVGFLAQQDVLKDVLDDQREHKNPKTWAQDLKVLEGVKRYIPEETKEVVEDAQEKKRAAFVKAVKSDDDAVVKKVVKDLIKSERPDVDTLKILGDLEKEVDDEEVKELLNFSVKVEAKKYSDVVVKEKPEEAVEVLKGVEHLSVDDQKELAKTIERLLVLPKKAIDTEPIAIDTEPIAKPAVTIDDLIKKIIGESEKEKPADTGTGNDEQAIDTEPIACPLNYAPVCAKDKTFGNDCQAKAAGYDVFEKGSCEELVKEKEIIAEKERALEEEKRLKEEQEKLEAEKKALEQKQLAEEELAKEKARLEAEQKRLEEEKRVAEKEAAEEKARLEAEKEAAEKAAKLEAERQAAEEQARREAEQKRLEEEKLEAEKQAAEEAAKLEAEKQAAEEAAKLEAEKQAAEEAKLEAEKQAAEEAAKLACQVVAPVCGVNGVTYENTCIAKEKAIDILHDGACKTTETLAPTEEKVSKEVKIYTHGFDDLSLTVGRGAAVRFINESGKAQQIIGDATSDLIKPGDSAVVYMPKVGGNFTIKLEDGSGFMDVIIF